MLNFRENFVFRCTMAKLILSITILFVNGYQVKAVSLMQGQEATLHFPYPCDSTEVTLQHSHRLPFYSSTDGSSLSLTQDQVQRFSIQNINNNANCYLECSISNLLRIDQGTYISLVYKDGELLVEQTHRIWLKVDYPPGKASCVVSNDKGGEWVSIDCTANVGSLSGEIECYQDGVWMPPLTDPTKTDTILKQTILIRKSQPVFCCSSTLTEHTERCECKDTALYLDDTSSSDPCPTTSTKTSTKTSTISTYRPPDLVINNQTFNSSNYLLSLNSTSKNAIKMTKDSLTAFIIYSILGTAVVIMFTLNVIFLYRLRQKRNYNSNDESLAPSLSRKVYSDQRVSLCIDDAQECVTEKLNQIQASNVPYCHQSLQEFAAHDFQNKEHYLRKYQSLDQSSHHIFREIWRKYER